MRVFQGITFMWTWTYFQVCISVPLIKQIFIYQFVLLTQFYVDAKKIVKVRYKSKSFKPHTRLTNNPGIT